MERSATVPTMRPETPISRIQLGELAGVWQDGVAVFRGVPYAAPPTGERRFAPTAQQPPWSSIHDATQHGPIAPQTPSRLRVAMGDFTRPQHEDCLTLTIWIFVARQRQATGTGLAAWRRLYDRRCISRLV